MQDNTRKSDERIRENLARELAQLKAAFDKLPSAPLVTVDATGAPAA